MKGGGFKGGEEKKGLTIANIQQCQGPHSEDLVTSVASWEMVVSGKPLMQRSVGCQVLPLLLLD